jgi:hypothetical protein
MVDAWIARHSDRQPASDVSTYFGVWLTVGGLTCRELRHVVPDGFAQHAEEFDVFTVVGVRVTRHPDYG